MDAWEGYTVKMKFDFDNGVNLAPGEFPAGPYPKLDHLGEKTELNEAPYSFMLSRDKDQSRIVRMKEGELFVVLQHLLEYECGVAAEMEIPVADFSPEPREKLRVFIKEQGDLFLARAREVEDYLRKSAEKPS
jgi:hypothetical protein